MQVNYLFKGFRETHFWRVDLKKILVIGDLNVDIIVSGMTEFPKLGREIHCGDIRTVMGGSASIFACRLAQLGAEVDILGVVGRDENGKIVLNTLRTNNVGLDKVITRGDVRTGVTLSLTFPKEKALVTFVGSIGALEPSDVKPEVFEGYAHVHISSIYFQPKLLGYIDEIFKEAKSRGLTTSLDTQDDPSGKYEKIWDILKHTDIFLPNDREAKGIANSSSLEDAIDKIGSKVKVLAVKCGSQGAIGKMGEKVVKVEPIEISPIDTTGAGDSFDAGFIYYFICKKRGFEDSLRFANAMGALSCLYIGGAGGKITERDLLKFRIKSGRE